MWKYGFGSCGYTVVVPNNMKRLLLYIILNFLICNIYTQNIKYQLVSKDTCNNTYDINYIYWIFKDTAELQKESLPELDLINGYSILNDTGTYYLSHGYYWGIPDRNPFHKVKITDFGLIIDTIVLGHLQEFTHYSNPPWTEYLCCGKPCNGQKSSFYENGNLKIKGEFLNGQPIGDLNTYYYSGELRESRTFEKNHRIYRYYGINDTLIRRYEERRLKKNRYWLIEKIEIFNRVGTPVEITIYKNNDIKRSFHYNTDGNLKYEIKGNKRIDYFKNGAIKSKLKWYKWIIRYEYCWNKFFFWKEDCLCGNEHDYIVKYKEFEKTGLIKLKAKLESWDRSRNYNPSTYMDADWIRYMKVYENNQLVNHIKDADNDDIK